MADGRHFENR